MNILNEEIKKKQKYGFYLMSSRNEKREIDALLATQYVIIRTTEYVKLTRSIIILMFLFCEAAGAGLVRSGGCWTSYFKNNPTSFDLSPSSGNHKKKSNEYIPRYQF